VQKLSTKMRTVATDIRGHGQSPTGSRHHFAQLADDIADLVSHIGCSQAYIVGYSATTSILLELLHRHPSIIRGLITTGGYARVHEWRLRSKLTFVEYTLKLGLISLMTTSTAMANSIDKTQYRQFKQGARNTDPRVILSILRESLAYDATALLRTTNVPLLLVYGAKDTNMHVYGQHIQQLAPSAELSIISGIGHAVPTHGSEAFSHCIEEFVGKVEKGRR